MVKFENANTGGEISAASDAFIDSVSLIFKELNVAGWYFSCHLVKRSCEHCKA